ncbi:protein SMG8-like isoform X2 [Amphibalanus amphitrite]|nr:protein SMG8-like isoform X2 [Amphibalanus amphitrite]
MRETIDESGLLTVWSELRYSAARALLLLFSVSHLVVLHHPNHVFDLSYIPLFLAIDACRQRLLRPVSDTLRSVAGLPSGWVNHGRPCPPRVLFHFGSVPPAVARHRPRSGRPATEQLQHSLEDQIYRLLRKVRLITNASVQSLFALPGNQPFVFVEGGRPPGDSDPLLAQVRLLHKLCLSDERGTSPPPDAVSALWPTQPASAGAAVSPSFATLVSRHLSTARGRGFDDNVGKHLAAPNFDLPPANLWFAACSKLYDELVATPAGSAFSKPLASLRSALDSDTRFSEARCAKVLPMAVSAYQEGLPARYSLDFHNRKLLSAMAVFRLHARGPCCGQYLARLEEECGRLWRQGRQICEALSLTGNPCINPVHRLPGQPEDEDDLEHRRPEMDHCSGVRYLSTCNCGRRQRQRDDPFTVRRANYEFYAALAESCCGGLQQHEFPVFRPGANKARAAVVSAADGGSEVAERTAPDPDNATISPTFGLGLSQGEADEAERSGGPTSSPSDISVTVKQESRRAPEVLPSTEEYLDGMVTTTTPRHLLPEYPSFSLVCLGQSSLYSHAAGLQGFLQGSNYLLPWELRMKTEKLDTRKGYIKKKETYDIYAKIFIGFEYECPRGHRFMLSAPDRVMKVAAAAQVKDSAATVATSDMPLYFNCPCSKKLKPFVSQLMRLHVVTPKSAVRVTLEPRVQPQPPDGAVFVPGGERGALELSPAAYWLLRLPYLYRECGGSTAAPPRQEVPPVGRGRLLKDMFGVVIRDDVL